MKTILGLILLGFGYATFAVPVQPLISMTWNEEQDGYVNHVVTLKDDGFAYRSNNGSAEKRVAKVKCDDQLARTIAAIQSLPPDAVLSKLTPEEEEYNKHCLNNYYYEFWAYGPQFEGGKKLISQSVGCLFIRLTKRPKTTQALVDLIFSAKYFPKNKLSTAPDELAEF